MLLKLQKIIVEEEVAGKAITKDITNRFKDIPVEYVTEAKTRKNGFKGGQLVVAKQKSSFVRKCPGTPGYSCCDYYILNIGIGCQFNCTYCFLHHYMNSPFIIYVNTEDALEEVRQFCARHSNKVIRLGSGEFIDSVGFDKLANFNQVLVPELSRISNLLFEVKTKSDKVGHLLNLEHRGRVVVSFSVNTEEVIRKEESEAASLQQRLQAAKKCQEAGYKIGFHFDPLIHYSGWEAGYKQVVDLIFEHIKTKNIAWISLGALRFNPHLKPIIQRRFPESRIVYGELVPGLDGKLRYFITIRKKMFKALVGYIRAFSNQVPVYLCMENKSLAKEVGTH